MKLFTTIYDDARLLSHFLCHCKKAGVTEFYIKQIDAVVSAFRLPPEVTLLRGLDVADSFYGGNAAVTEMRRRYQSSYEWVIICDLDEFIEFPSSIEAVVDSADNAGANVVRATMFDRFSIDGRLINFGPESDLSQLYPVKARFIANVLDGADYKGVLVKGELRASVAHHEFVDEIVYPELLEISHYKWSSTNALDRVKSAYQTLTKRGAHWAEEYRIILEHYERYGRFAWETFGGQLSTTRRTEFR
jgi:hypothetical protein